MDFYVLENSNNYVLKKLRDETGAFVNDASITVEFQEYNPETKTYVPVLNVDGSDPGWPLAFLSEGNGNYRVHIPPTLAMLPREEYVAIIEGTFGGRVLYEKRQVFAQRRLTK